MCCEVWVCCVLEVYVSACCRRKERSEFVYLKKKCLHKYRGVCVCAMDVCVCWLDKCIC